MSKELQCLPVSVVLQGIKDILGIWMDEVCPRLPQWVDNVVDEPNLTARPWKMVTTKVYPTCDFSMVALYRSHMGLMSSPASLSLSPCWKNSSMILPTHTL